MRRTPRCKGIAGRNSWTWLTLSMTCWAQSRASQDEERYRDMGCSSCWPGGRGLGLADRRSCSRRGCAGLACSCTSLIAASVRLCMLSVLFRNILRRRITNCASRQVPQLSLQLLFRYSSREDTTFAKKIFIFERF
jgi:hypothetical protein